MTKRICVYIVFLHSSGCYNLLQGDTLRLLRARPSEELEEWTPPEVEWSDPGGEIPDIASFGTRLVIDPLARPGLAQILARSGTLRPLGGDAIGRSVHIPARITTLKDMDNIVGDWECSLRGPTQNSNIRRWAFRADELPLNVLVNELGIGKICIEDESPGPQDRTNPRGCGLRKWVKDHGYTGALFKRIWSSDQVVEYSPQWFFDAVDDPSLWD